MATTGKTLNLSKPQMTETVDVTIPNLANNMQVIDDNHTAHVNNTTQQFNDAQILLWMGV